MHEELRRSNSVGNAEGISFFLSLIFVKNQQKNRV